MVRNTQIAAAEGGVHIGLVEGLVERTNARAAGGRLYPDLSQESSDRKGVGVWVTL